MRVLLTGATGYIGSHFLEELKKRDVIVRCLTRNAQTLKNIVPPPHEIVQADLQNLDSLYPAMEGIDIAYYLVHSMDDPHDFQERDRVAAQNFIECAGKMGLKRIIYLGGLGKDDDHLSKHLKSRHEVGDILRSSDVSTIEFRASIIIGAGSRSFELIRALVENLPVLITPHWVSVEAQPIGIDDVLAYLLAGLDHTADKHRIYEIGGAERASYIELIREYSRQCHLRRLIVAVPLLTPWLSSLWLRLVVPRYARLGKKLLEGIRNPTVVTDFSALNDFKIRPESFRTAMALAREETKKTENVKTASGKEQTFAFVALLFLCLGVGYAGGILTDTSVHDWYQTLNKPAWTPPDWIFAPVWSALYVLMAIAAWLIWRLGYIKPVKVALAIFGVQLFLNMLWSGIFFRLKMPAVAAFELALLWSTLALTTIAFWGLSLAAAALMAPYFLWVSFAFVLNIAIALLN